MGTRFFLLQTQKVGSQRKIDHDAEDIGNGGNQRGTGCCGVEFQFRENKRQQQADQTANHYNRNHGKGNDINNFGWSEFSYRRDTDGHCDSQ